MALALEMANRIIAGEVQPVVCLDAPEPDDARTPPALRRDLDGRSVFMRPGVSRYATEVQLSREEKLLERARQEGAPRLTRAQAAPPAAAPTRRSWTRSCASRCARQDRGAMQPSGLSAAQQAAAYHVLTSPRRCEVIEAPAGAGKTHVLAAARPDVPRRRDPCVRARRRASSPSTSCRPRPRPRGWTWPRGTPPGSWASARTATYRGRRRSAPGCGPAGR